MDDPEANKGGRVKGGRTGEGRGERGGEKGWGRGRGGGGWRVVATRGLDRTMATLASALFFSGVSVTHGKP